MLTGPSWNLTPPTMHRPEPRRVGPGRIPIRLRAASPLRRRRPPTAHPNWRRRRPCPHFRRPWLPRRSWSRPMPTRRNRAAPPSVRLAMLHDPSQLRCRCGPYRS
ncbi:MAG: hypothetical protein EOS78_11705 [Mesorhizobium sp.]|nr:MAG: hypothetical protein EOS78_11705 [Mesorhizobium sp.]